MKAKRYYVTATGFGHTVSKYVEAESADAAYGKIAKDYGIKIKVKVAGSDGS